MSTYGVVKMAEGAPIYEDYHTLARTPNSTIRAKERALSKQIQDGCDATAPIIDIQRQLKREVSDDENKRNDDDGDDASEPVTG